MSIIKKFQKSCLFLSCLGILITLSSSPAYSQVVDTTPPLVVEAEALSKTSLRISFNEALDRGTAEDAYNYTISPQLTVTGVVILTDQRLVRLATSRQDFGTAYTVTINNVRDMAGNTVAPNSSVAFGGFSPHGMYIKDTDLCGHCHRAHAARGAQLLNREDMQTMCYVCHDSGGQSEFIIGNEFNMSSRHPVSEGVLNCTSCHNPHGDKKDETSIFPRLLHTKAGESTYYSGPEFCLACHGSFKQNFTKPGDSGYDYYEASMGDYSNPDAAHYDTTETTLLPASGTKVTCVKCHRSHGSSNTGLLIEEEEVLCYQCHNDPANSRSGVDIQSQFNLTSRHHISSSDQADGSRVECISCHGPHTVSKLPLDLANSRSDLCDPDNIKKVFTANPSAVGKVTIGTMTDFCLKCHDGSPPEVVQSVYTLVPYTISWPNLLVTTNGGGWGNKTMYNDSSHKARGIMCNGCHKPHGSAYPLLQNLPEDTGATDGQCLTCHNGSYSGAVNVKNSFARSFNHPTLAVGGKHSNTENYNDMPLSDRHAECVDCHDPHAANSDGAPKPNANGYVRNVSGVNVSTDEAIRPEWTSLASNSLGYTFVNKITKSYQVCYKCHTTYSYGTTPPPGQWDVARAFNPNNPSYHPIEAQGKNNMNWTGNNPLDYSTSSFVYGWSASSFMVCTDCHADSESSLKGVHGSGVAGILKAPYTDDTGVTEANDTDLCFLCHSWSTYQDRSGNDNTGFYNQGAGNLHTKRHGELPCMTCHTAVPHGSRRERMMALHGDGMPLASTVNKVNSWTRNTRNYVISNCTTAAGCHPE